MAQIKLLKIHATDGVPVEMDTASDDITLSSFTVQGGGPALSSTGLDANNTDVSDVNDLTFNNPATGTINQTAGNLVIDDLMAKDRSNTLTTSADILFPVITDTAAEVDAFRIPALAGIPSATPTTSGSGFLVYNSSQPALYVWNGTAWDDMSTVTTAENVDNMYTANGAIAARDVVYISAADSVSPASASTLASAQAIGVATASAADTTPVSVRKNGIVTGFSGLTAGSRYYVSGSTAGAITTSIPTASGHTIVSVGFAKSATALDLQIQSLGRRA